MNQENKAHSEELLTDAREYWWNDDYLALLAKRLDLNECDTLVDVGCGIGHLVFKLAPYLKMNCRVYGFDFENSYIDEAKKKATLLPNQNNIEFVFQQGDANNIPLEDSKADVAICQTLLMHVSNPLKVIQEMKRVTKKNGLIVAIEPNNMSLALLSNVFFSKQNIEKEIENTLKNIEIMIRIEHGKKMAGEGYNSIGDSLPILFREAKLNDIQVWLADKALSIIPPYDNIEKQSRVKEQLTWISNKQVVFDYQRNLKYYLKGGGSKMKFNQYWNGIKKISSVLKEAFENEKYITAGGSVMYIAAGRKL
jgi:ubiquinone/menaquinone biosynthesis C-methylase UbiE